LYMMNIGEAESKEERVDLIRKQREERAKERFKESTGIDPDIESRGPEISVESNVVTILPSSQNFSKEDRDHPVSFVVSGDDASATMPKAKPPVSAPGLKKQPPTPKREP